MRLASVIVALSLVAMMMLAAPAPAAGGGVEHGGRAGRPKAGVASTTKTCRCAKTKCKKSGAVEACKVQCDAPQEAYCACGWCNDETGEPYSKSHCYCREPSRVEGE